MGNPFLTRLVIKLTIKFAKNTINIHKSIVVKPIDPLTPNKKYYKIYIHPLTPIIYKSLFSSL